MSEHISVILDKVLERLDAAEPLESVLADYPSQRDELMSLLAVVRELSSLQKAPPLIAPEAGLAAFLDEAQALAPEAAARRARWRWLDERLVALKSLSYSRTWAAARAMTFLVLLLVLVGGIMCLSASSLPGDWLYPVKLVGEEARLSLTFSQGARAEYHLQRAWTRAEEVQRLVRAGCPVDEQALARLEKALESSLLAAASADQSETPRLLFAIEQMSVEQAALLEVVQVVAVNSRTYQLLDQARASLAQAASLAQMGQANVYAFRLNARLGAFQLGSPSLLLETESPSVTLSPTPTFAPGAEDSVYETQTCTPTTTPTARATRTHTPTTRPSDTPALSLTLAPSSTPEPDDTPEPPTATATLASPTVAGTLEPTPHPTSTPQPPPPTNTPQPPPTNTPPPPTNTPQPPPTDTPQPPPTDKPQPPGLTNTPQPPGQTKTPKPPQPTKTPKP